MLTVTLDDQTEAALNRLVTWYASTGEAAPDGKLFRALPDARDAVNARGSAATSSSTDCGPTAVRDALRSLKSEDIGTSLTSDTLFADAAQRWLTEFRVDAENGIYSWASVDTYSDHLRNHVLPALGSLRLIEVTTPVINELCQRNLKNHSLCLAKHTKVVIGNVMTFSVQAGAIDRNPTKEIDKLVAKRARSQTKAARALTTEQVLDLLAKLDTDDEAVRRDLPDLVRFFIATGERLGEAVGARWSDFDQTTEVVTVTGNIIQARGKGVVRNTGKSKMTRRTIPLPGWCVRMLENRQTKLGVIDVDKPIFSNARGGYLNTSNLNNRYWMPFRKRAGYEWVTFHTFRKTVATLLDEAGLTARQIADILGHANPSMTQNVYMGRGQVSRSGASALEKIAG